MTNRVIIKSSGALGAALAAIGRRVPDELSTLADVRASIPRDLSSVEKARIARAEERRQRRAARRR